MTSVTRKRYTAEFKAQAVGLVGIGKPVSEVAKEFEIGEGVLYGWVRKSSQAAHLGSEGPRAAGELPATASITPPHPPRPRPPTPALGDLIETVFKHHRRRYGYRRLGRELSDQGVTCAPTRVRHLMARRNLRALQPKNFVPKTSDGRADRPSPNLLSGQPLPALPDHAWAGDITFIPTREGWLYLAVVIDLCSRRIVGWSLADHMRSDLVLCALQQALQTRPTHHTIFHSDRGSQYASTPFRNALARACHALC